MLTPAIASDAKVNEASATAAATVKDFVLVIVHSNPSVRNPLRHSAAIWIAARLSRGKTWLKTKCFTESNFVVVGIDRDQKTGAPRALLAHPGSAGLNYAGAAFIALGGDERSQFFAEVERLTTSWETFKSSRLTDVKWCQPKLRVQ